MFRRYYAPPVWANRVGLGQVPGPGGVGTLRPWVTGCGPCTFGPYGYVGYGPYGLWY